MTYGRNGGSKKVDVTLASSEEGRPVLAAPSPAAYDSSACRLIGP